MFLGLAALFIGEYFQEILLIIMTFQLLETGKNKKGLLRNCFNKFGIVKLLENFFKDFWVQNYFCFFATIALRAAVVIKSWYEYICICISVCVYCIFKLAMPPDLAASVTKNWWFKKTTLEMKMTQKRLGLQCQTPV